jgi:hypothetical protein
MTNGSIKDEGGYFDELPERQHFYFTRLQIRSSKFTDKDECKADERDHYPVPPSKANVVSSLVPSSRYVLRFRGYKFLGRRRGHAPVLDLDYNARLVRSTSHGHWHLYLDGVRLPWWKYRVVLKTLAWAGIIEDGFYQAAVIRKRTQVRLPHIKKPEPTGFFLD